MRISYKRGMSLNSLNINPSSPSIEMQTLLASLHSFITISVGRICLNIKAFMFDDHILYSYNPSGDVVRGNYMLMLS